MQKIKIVALIGEAGSGKDFLLRCAREQYPEFHEIISCTTRPKRMGEVEGRNYYFLENQNFIDKVANLEMLEYTEFNGWYYGTMLSALKPDQVNIGVFNPAGIKRLLKREDIDLKVFYVRAPAKTRLMRQLQREDDPNVDEVVRRYQTDKADFEKLPFEYIDLNNITQSDVTKAMELIGQERLANLA